MGRPANRKEWLETFFELADGNKPARMFRTRLGIKTADLGKCIASIDALRRELEAIYAVEVLDASNLGKTETKPLPIPTMTMTERKPKKPSKPAPAKPVPTIKEMKERKVEAKGKLKPTKAPKGYKSSPGNRPKNNKLFRPESDKRQKPAELGPKETPDDSWRKKDTKDEERWDDDGGATTGSD